MQFPLDFDVPSTDILGLDSLHHMLKPEFGCSRKRVHRQMRLAGIASARHRAYKATTNSRHNHPPALDLLQRNFCCKPPKGLIFHSDRGVQYAAIAFRASAQADIFAYLETFYNSGRPHSALGWLSPTQFETSLLASPAA